MTQVLPAPTLSREASPSDLRSASSNPPRRLTPRIYDTDWLVLRGMRVAIAAFTAHVTKPGQTVVDFGCGDQPYATLFTDAGCRYLGADFGAGAAFAITGEGRLLVDSAKADLLTSFQVLEHVRDLDRYFSEARRVVRDDGWMILSTHGSWLYHPHPEDHRRWTREGLVNEIETHGFDVVDVIPIVGPLGWTTMLRLTGFCYVLRRIPLIGGFLGAGLAVMMNARAWLEDRVTPMSITRDNACTYVTLCRPKPVQDGAP